MTKKKRSEINFIETETAPALTTSRPNLLINQKTKKAYKVVKRKTN